MSLYETALNTLFNDPHLRRRGADDPDTVLITYPTGKRFRVVPMEQTVSEFNELGIVLTQAYAKTILVRIGEVDGRPPRNSTVTGYEDTFVIDSAEYTPTRSAWVLSLSVEQ